MSLATTIAVLDIGKTNAKLVCWDDATGQMVQETCRPNRSIEGSEYRYLDTDGLWNFYRNALREAASIFDIGKLVVTTHGATAAILQGDELALPVVDYENPIASAVSSAYDALRDHFAQTFSPALPAGLNLGRQLFALEQSHGAILAQATDFLLYPQFWAFKLCGVKASEVTSLGCHTDIFMPFKGEFSDLAQKRGWAAKFPPLRKASDVLGTVRPELVAELGLRPDCQVLCGIHDSNASLVPLFSQFTPPFALCSSGTWVINFAVQGAARNTPTSHHRGNSRNRPLQEELDTLCNVDLHGRPVPSSRFMGGREYAVLTSECATVTPTQADLQRVIANQSFATPSFCDNGGPFARHGGRIHNASALTTDAERVALACLYVALMTDYCLDTVQARGPLVLEGPYAASPLLSSLMAALRAPRQKVFTTHDTHGTAFGAAMLAFTSPDGRTRPYNHVLPAELDQLAEYRHRWRLALPNT